MTELIPKKTDDTESLRKTTLATVKLFFESLEEEFQNIESVVEQDGFRLIEEHFTEFLGGKIDVAVGDLGADEVLEKISEVFAECYEMGKHQDSFERLCDFICDHDFPFSDLFQDELLELEGADFCTDDSISEDDLSDSSSDEEPAKMELI